MAGVGLEPSVGIYLYYAVSLQEGGEYPLGQGAQAQGRGPDSSSGMEGDSGTPLPWGA